MMSAACNRLPARPTLRRSRRAAAGFTLVEVTVTAAILLILLAFLFIPTVTAFNLFHHSKATAELQADARYVLDQMTKDIRHAILVYNIDDSFYTDLAAGESYYERLNFILPETSGGQPTAPLRPRTQAGTTVPSLFVYYRALRDPGKPYGSYDSNNTDDLNPYLLYRAEIVPSDSSFRQTTAVLTEPTDTDGDGTADYGVPVVAGTTRTHTAILSREDVDVERLSFEPLDSDGDGYFDIVNIDLIMAREDASGSAIRRPRAHVTTTVQLPNVK